MNENFSNGTKIPNKQTNKQTNKQIHLIMSKKSVLVYLLLSLFFYIKHTVEQNCAFTQKSLNKQVRPNVCLDLRRLQLFHL